MQELNRTDGNSRSIEKSVVLLNENLKEIPTVTAWAELVGYARPYFSNLFSEHFGERPLKYLCRVRYQRLQKLVLQYPNETSRSISHRLGLNNECNLYIFLDRHFDTNFTEVRSRLLETEKDRRTPRECYSQLQKLIIEYPYETRQSISQRMGFNSTYKLYDILNKHFDTTFTKVRNRVLKENGLIDTETPGECYNRLMELIMEYPNETSQSISQRLGFNSGPSLYLFLNKHFDTNFTEVRNKLLNSD